LRTIAESAQYAYAKSADSVSVNLYGASRLETELAGISKVKLTQETEYPWNGRIRITVNETGGKEFGLKLRIPGWTKGATLRLNRRPIDGGQDLQTLGATGKYFELRRAWRPGDTVELDLWMDTELIEANPLVEETLGQVAVKRGPVVYCLESVDLPRGVKPLDVSLALDAKLRARYDQRLLGGVVVLEGVASARTNAGWNGQLYRELQPAKPALIKLRLIPYSVWANRGPSEMSVWLPLAKP
jgi:DUF1680 family protein